MQFKAKKTTVEAITFDELVEFGKSLVSDLHNGMPWSFEYEGIRVTHENDNCYLIPTNSGITRFERGDMLVTAPSGEVYPMKFEAFSATYGSEDV